MTLRGENGAPNSQLARLERDLIGQLESKKSKGVVDESWNEQLK
jgi:hypothetical protein